MSELSAWRQDPEELVLRYLENPRADLKDLILLQYASMVERIARRFSGIEPQEDLVQVGYIGLLNALSKFDVAAGVRFNTYATYLVAGEIKHYLRDRSQTIRQPAWLQEMRHKVNKAAGVLTQTLGRVPNEREIAEHIGVSEAAVLEVFATQELMKIASLDAGSQTEEEGESDVEKLDAAEFCPEQLCFEDRMLLEGALGQLRDLEKVVLTHFHFDSMNQTEIATKLGISCNYVSHILRQSLAKLRKILTAEAEKDRVLRREAEVSDSDLIDEQTGAYTEAYFRGRIEEEIHRASFNEEQVGLMFIDFKGVERLREFYGAQAIVDFMTDAAEFCRQQVRRLDMVSRYGKTGFAIIFPATGQDVTLIQARLISALRSWLGQRTAAKSPVSVHVGTAVYPRDGKFTSQVLEVARAKPLELDNAA